MSGEIVVRGNPTPEEVAAVVAVLAARGPVPSAPPPPPSAWATPSRRFRTPLPSSGWRSSALPR